METDRADGLTDGQTDGWMSETERGIRSGPHSPTEEHLKTLDYANVVVNLINYWWTVHQKHT